MNEAAFINGKLKQKIFHQTQHQEFEVFSLRIDTKHF